MSDQAPKRRLAAILAADVVGCSRLMEKDEAGTLAVLKSRRKQVLEPLVSRNEGRVFKIAGDGVLVEFGSAVNAVQCAVDLQSKMAEANGGVPTDRHIILRIGINLGDVMVEGSDLYGDGVNIAARLEAIAEPGGILASGTAHDYVRNKVKVVFDDLGLQTLKNIAEPVRAYRVSGTPAVALTQPEPASDRPSIAVLPFTNMSGDPEQDYFSDGITENIITDLARFHDLFVIARNSSFAYRGKATRIGDVSRALGVRYILEGSVQRSDERVRITAQLIDGVTGRHLWAERYDKLAKDTFKVQDEVTETIVGTLATAYGGRLHKAWRGRAGSEDSRSVQALDYFQRGIELADRFTKEDAQRSREYLLKAIELDPNYGKAFSKLAWLHLFDVVFGWGENAEASLVRAFEFADLAVQRDDDEAWGHWAMGACYLIHGEAERALQEYHRALELNPNDADLLAEYGSCLSFVGRPKEGLDSVQKAMKLNPHHPEWYVMIRGQAFFDARRYGDAIATLGQLREFETVSARLCLAASHAAAGNAGEAQKAVARALEIDPHATIKQMTKLGRAPYRESGDLAHFLDNLRKAGLPEG